MKTKGCAIGSFAILLLFSAAAACAQDVTMHVTYVCSGERIFIDSCNIRDVSDTSTCTVAHPDKIQANGIMAYTTQTRGALKKLLPTCKQPTKDELAKSKAFDKKVTDTQAAKEKKANDENDAIEARAQAVISGKKPMTADQKAMNRCITAGRVPAVCEGNALSKGFADMLGKLLPTDLPPVQPGLVMGGNFEGAGAWRIEFDEQGAAMQCSDLVPSAKAYTIEVKNDQAILKIESNPKPLILAMRADGTLVGAGPIVVHGAIVSGHSGGGGYNAGTAPSSSTSTQTHTETMTPMEAQGHQYDAGTFTQNGGMVDHTTTQTVTTYNAGTPASYSGPTVTYAPATRTCKQAVLSSKHAAAGGTDVAKGFATALFNGGDSGPVAPPGLRMHGTYGGEGGISVEFYPESAIVACGDSARAYPYNVQIKGSQAVVKIEDPARELLLAMQADGELNPGAGPYLVHGRRITGQNDDGDFTFAPLNATCNLSLLKPGATASAPPATVSVAAAPGAGANSSGLKTATPGAPTGTAVLSIVSGFPTGAGAANPLAGKSLILLRDTLATALTKGGFSVPAGTSPYKVIAATCATRTPDCQQLLGAINSDSAALTRADATGKGDLPGVPPGFYFLMVSTKVNNQTLTWGFQVELKTGANKLTLDQRNAVPLN